MISLIIHATILFALAQAAPVVAIIYLLGNILVGFYILSTQN